jgi:glycosyltransferase involved in cell wall biosynthesis
MSYPFVTSWSLIESMGLGLAIVGSRTQPVEAVISDRETGFLFDFFDRQALVEQVVDLLANPRKADQVRRNAQATARQRYDFEGATWPAYQDLFRELLA